MIPEWDAFPGWGFVCSGPATLAVGPNIFLLSAYFYFSFWKYLTRCPDYVRTDVSPATSYTGGKATD